MRGPSNPALSRISGVPPPPPRIHGSETRYAQTVFAKEVDSGLRLRRAQRIRKIEQSTLEMIADDWFGVVHQCPLQLSPTSFIGDPGFLCLGDCLVSSRGIKVKRPLFGDYKF